MNKKLTEKLHELLEKPAKDLYHFNRAKHIFHVSEMAKCTELVLYQREHPPKTKAGTIEAWKTIGKAYENYISYKLQEWDNKENWDIKSHIPVFIPMSYEVGIRGSPDLMFRQGGDQIPIEIKTTKDRSLEHFKKDPKLNIQGCSYGYGVMSPIWVLIAASKSNSEQGYFEMSTQAPIMIKNKSYIIDELLKLKLMDLIDNPEEHLFSPMFKRECWNCPIKATCIYSQ